MWTYFSKAEDETSEAIKQTAKEVLNVGRTEFETIKAIANAYSTKRECSVQEAAYHILTRTLDAKNIFKSNFFWVIICQKSGIGFLKRNAKLISSQEINLISNVIC